MQQDNTIPQPPHGNTTNFPPPPDQPMNEKKPGPLKRFLENYGVVLAAPLIAVFLIVFVFQSYQVDGPSMEETLQDEDRLVVLKIGKTIAELRNQDYLPGRGSIIIFNAVQTADRGGADRQLVKRVIGLPGERVRISNGKVTIYNEQFPAGFNPDKEGDYGELIDDFTNGNIDLTVQDGEVFVLGDNRDMSSDSRAFGTVQSQQIIGELALRIYPFNALRTF